jgi:hypothetical protein
MIPLFDFLKWSPIFQIFFIIFIGFILKEVKVLTEFCLKKTNLKFLFNYIYIFLNCGFSHQLIKLIKKYNEEEKYIESNYSQIKEYDI